VVLLKWDVFLRAAEPAKGSCKIPLYVGARGKGWDRGEASSRGAGQMLRHGGLGCGNFSDTSGMVPFHQFMGHH